MTGAQGWPLRWAPAWIVLLVAVWPVATAAHGVLALGALAGLGWLLWRRSRDGVALLSGPAWALTGVMFCAYWLPEAIATMDAEVGRQAWRGVALDLQMLPVLWLAAAAAAQETGRRRVFAGLAGVAVVWLLDGLLAATTGSGLLHDGYAAGARVLDHAGIDLSGLGFDGASGNGVLDVRWMWLLLACLSPFALDWASRKAAVGWLAMALLFAVAIALSQVPAAWLAYGGVLALELVRAFDRRRLAAVLVVAGIAVGLAWSWQTQAPDRFEVDAAVAVGAQAKRTAAPESSSWRDALCILQTHPINGVGVGGIALAERHCTPASAAARGGEGEAMPWLLEVLLETGVIGLLLWLSGAALAWRAWRYADVSARTRAWPALQALLVTLFPLNASLPVYASVWGSVVVLMAGLYAGALWGRIDPEPAPQS